MNIENGVSLFRWTYVSNPLVVALFGAVFSTVPTDGFAQTIADTVLYNGNILTVDSKFGVVQAIAIADGKVLAAGTNDQVRKTAGSNTQLIDLHGKTVTPGFSDNHLHEAGGGPGVDLSQVKSFKEFLNAIAVRVTQSTPGAIIVANGDWHPGQLQEERMPLRRDIDAVSPNNPVVIPRDGHVTILNTKALERWNITKETPVPAGGKISRYPDGELDGLLLDRARGLVKLETLTPTLEEKIRDKQDQYARLNAAGITSIRHPGIFADEYHTIMELKRRGLLTVRINALFRYNPAESLKSADDVAAWLKSLPAKQGEGDQWVRIWGIKMSVDGGVEGGLMTEPYAEPFGLSGTYKGVQTVPTETYMIAAREISKAGWRLATHAVGDAAIDLVLSAYDAANTENSIVGKRWAIEHGFVPRMDQFEPMNRLAIIASLQDHLYVSGATSSEQWGSRRANMFTPVRTYLDSLTDKMSVSSGTDSAVVPYQPLLTFFHFVTRETINGRVYGPEQRVSREEALRLATINNAYLTFDENIKGSLEPGKLADLVVLPDDIMTIDAHHIKDIKPLMTMVGGAVVYKDTKSPI